MAVRNLAFHSISAIFAVLIVLANWASHCVRLVLAPVHSRSILVKNMNKKWRRVGESGKRQILQYVQIVVHIIIGALFTKILASYHSFFIKTIVTISFQLHLLSLNWVIELPDYSAYLNDSESFKMITGLLCLIFGYLGLSIQLSFTLDLISFFSYPFRALQRRCDKAYLSLLKLKSSIIDILTINQKYWVTCPYPDYLLKDSYKMVYICALPLLFSLIVLTKAYSVFMSTLIVVSQIVISIGQNVCQLVEEAGRVFCIILGLQVQNQRLCLNKLMISERFRSLEARFQQLEWLPIFEWAKFRQIFSGVEYVSGNYQQEKSLRYVSIINVYETFANYLR